MDLSIIVFFQQYMKQQRESLTIVTPKPANEKPLEIEN